MRRTSLTPKMIKVLQAMQGGDRLYQWRGMDPYFALGGKPGSCTTTAEGLIARELIEIVPGTEERVQIIYRLTQAGKDWQFNLATDTE